MNEEGMLLLLGIIEASFEIEVDWANTIRPAWETTFFTRPIQRLEMSEPEAGRTVKKANEQSRNRGRRRVPGITARHQCQERRMRDQAPEWA
jgi:hypothetical protein